MIEQAISIDRQLELMRSRGLAIADPHRAAEFLSVIGFYRLGTYLFPFEETYPDFNRATHRYRPGIEFMDAVRLYHFDLELRNLFLKYIFSIEVYFRAVLTYEGSMLYRHDPWWFVNPECVTRAFISDFDRAVYNPAFRKNAAIKRHHRMAPADRYAPAWKTIELMTLGENIKLFNALTDPHLQHTVSTRLGVNYVDVFRNYIELVRVLRNACAHGCPMFDFRPPTRIRKGPAALDRPEQYMNIAGCLKVVRYLLRHVLPEREQEMMRDFNHLTNSTRPFPAVMDVLRNVSGLDMH